MSKLCFGSYVQVFVVHYSERSEQTVNDLLSSIKNDISVDKGNVSRLVNCKMNLSDDIIQKSQTNKVIDNIEEYFDEYIIPNMRHFNIEQCKQDLQRLILGDKSIPEQTKSELLSCAPQLSLFLSKVFLYSVVQNNICENALENLGDLDFIKPAKFEQTSISNGFDKVFIEVPQDKNLELTNSNHIKTFHLNVQNNNFTFDALNNYLLKNIGRYVYSRMQLEEFKSNDAQETIASKAISLLKDKGYTKDEFGNIVIYLFLENILKAPKLYTNFECINSEINKSGVHLLKLDGIDNSFQMVFSKSNIKNNIRDSIDASFRDLSSLINSLSNHYKFLETSVLNQNYDTSTANELKNIILPHKRSNNIVDNAYGILIGYSISVDKNTDNISYRNNLNRQMIDDLQNNISYIISKINELNLQNSSFYIYLIPFDNAENDNENILKALVGGE